MIRTPTFEGLTPASEAASRAKRANPAQDTRPELLLRRAVWKLGLRYRKNVRSLPGVPDLVFSLAKVVVFCDGDFWHGRNWRRLRAALQKRHNPDYWVAKIRRNRLRDRIHVRALAKAGWHILRFWESEIIADPGDAAERIRLVVTSSQRRRSSLAC